MKKKQIERLGKMRAWRCACNYNDGVINARNERSKSGRKGIDAECPEADEISAEKIGHLMGDDNSENAKHLIMPDEYFILIRSLR